MNDKTAAYAPTPENDPTLAAHAKAAEFGHNLSSTAAAYIAEAVLAASGLRAADRRAAPDREPEPHVLARAIYVADNWGLSDAGGDWDNGRIPSFAMDRYFSLANRLLASGVLGTPASEAVTLHAYTDADLDLIRAEAVEAFAATWSDEPADADEYEVRQHALKFAAGYRKAVPERRSMKEES